MKLPVPPPEVKVFDMKSSRTSSLPVNSLFLNRWSPRSYETTSMPEQDIHTIIEAARWAPSANNIQPWRFIYCSREDNQWDSFVAMLDEFNANWAQNASSLIVLVSDAYVDTPDAKAAKTSGYNSFDAGAAWAQLALQASQMGYSAHAMAGIHKDRIQETLALPNRFKIEIVIAIGKKGKTENLPEYLQAREQPSTRLELHEIAFKGVFENAKSL